MTEPSRQILFHFGSSHLVFGSSFRSRNATSSEKNVKKQPSYANHSKNQKQLKYYIVMLKTSTDNSMLIRVKAMKKEKKKLLANDKSNRKETTENIYVYMGKFTSFVSFLFIKEAMSTIGFSYKTIWMFAKTSTMCHVPCSILLLSFFSLKLRNWSFNVHDAKHSYRRNFSQKKKCMHFEWEGFC